mmetsp:Transcript_67083/g.169374  ORF Transcript_67083/g.169374 Transcript_67083/m.169374 type:complete len:193 (-) Transcript_67083:415-993(-)
MSDTRWGFQKEYAHKHMPNKWSTSSGFSMYHPNPLLKKSFRTSGHPVQMEDHAPRTTSYSERPQTARECMSAYGCHRDVPWDSSLRSPRNPFPGMPTRETRYVQQPSPAATPRRGSAFSRAASARVGSAGGNFSGETTTKRLQRLQRMGMMEPAADDTYLASLGLEFGPDAGLEVEASRRPLARPSTVGFRP